MSILVSTDQLARELSHGARPRLLDVRWRLNEPEGRPAYLGGHLPGAVYVDLERELASPGHPELGRHPLPTSADLSRAARRWGIDPGDRVVVYDDNDGVAAARAWWVLRGHGVDVRVLDGGFRSWVLSGRRIDRGDQAVRPGTVEFGPSQAPVASIDEAAAAPRLGVLVDVRAPQHYRGQVVGSEPGAGHIPGAVNIPTVTHIDPDGRLQPREQIRATLETWGIRPGDHVVLYCNNGIPSMHSALAFAVADVDTLGKRNSSSATSASSIVGSTVAPDRAARA